jgi:hypothetical protein
MGLGPCLQEQEFIEGTPTHVEVIGVGDQASHHITSLPTEKEEDEQEQVWTRHPLAGLHSPLKIDQPIPPHGGLANDTKAESPGGILRRA